MKLEATLNSRLAGSATCKWLHSRQLLRGLRWGWTVVVLLVALVAGTVQAQEVNIGPSQASISGRMASKMKTSLEPLDVTTRICCEHSLVLFREEVSMLWMTDEGSLEVKHDSRIWDVQVWSTDPGSIQDKS
jgi:hypothetical protein